MRYRYLALPSLLVLLGCGGSEAPSNSNPGPSQPSQTSIQYSNPTSSGWRLIQNTQNSQAGLLALDLVGPSDVKVRGVGFTLRTETATLTFAKYGDGQYLKDPGVFKLYSLDPQEAVLRVGGVEGDRFLVGIFQKDPLEPAKSCNAPVVQCQLQLKQGVKKDWPVSLEVLKAMVLPEDISSETAHLESIQIAIGQITLK